jgi:aryl-alcohol dehydrogenase-like predicted oxidoreductase
MFYRRLGHSELQVSALGLGCWAIGGPMHDLKYPDVPSTGWGKVDDHESIRAIQRAIDLGVNFFDTSNAYGCGHSEWLLGQALGAKREEVIIATKFGKVIDEQRRVITARSASPGYIRQTCEDSLRRLNRDYIDLFQFHESDWPVEDVPEILEVLDDLISAGKIRFYGWSTDDPERARAFAKSPNCIAIQHALYVFSDPVRIDKLLSVCEQHNLASIDRSPLMMGVLTGKFTPQTEFPEDDIRHDWDFSTGRFAKMLEKVEAIRDILTSSGRTPAQGALAWIWARSPRTIPIPGFRNQLQVEENIAAVEYGPLDPEQMQEIDRILER